MKTLDLDWVRAQFPALTDELAFFDNAGGSAACVPVIERASAHVRESMVQLGGTHPWSVDATEKVAAGHRAAATLMGGRVEDVALTPSTTASMARLASAFAPALEPGDEIVVTDLDHEANVGAFRRLGEGPEARPGVAVREWRFDEETHTLTEEGLRAVLSERTRLVAFTHCSNVVGALHDVERLAAVAHEVGARVVVDGVAFAPHRRVDVADLGVDAYAFSAYKVYGPHLGLLWVAPGFREELASRNHYFLPTDTAAYQLEPGSASHELAVAIPGIVAYLEALAETHGVSGLDGAFDAIAAQEEALVAPLIELLANRSGVRLMGPASADRTTRAPTIAFAVEGVDVSTIPPQLDARGVSLRSGHFYAHRAVKRLGLLDGGGLLRASMVHYNTLGEVERLVTALDEVLPS
jgi:cysteine desulfurase family protein (TIGR01976 family)